MSLQQRLLEKTLAQMHRQELDLEASQASLKDKVKKLQRQRDIDKADAELLAGWHEKNVERKLLAVAGARREHRDCLQYTRPVRPLPEHSGVVGFCKRPQHRELKNGSLESKISKLVEERGDFVGRWYKDVHGVGIAKWIEAGDIWFIEAHWGSTELESVLDMEIRAGRRQYRQGLKLAMQFLQLRVGLPGAAVKAISHFVPSYVEHLAGECEGLEAAAVRLSPDVSLREL